MAELLEQSKRSSQDSNASDSIPLASVGIAPNAHPPISAYQRLIADGALLLTTILWGINIPVVKFATSSVPPLMFNATRMILSTLVLGLLALAESRFVAQPTAKLNWTRFIVFALFSGFLYPLLFMWGIERTTAGNTALLLSTMPLWTAIVSAMFIGERLPMLTWLSLGVAFIGTAVVVIAGGKVSLSADNFWGDMLILLAALVWASGTVISGPLLKQVTALRLAFFASLFTTPLHLLLVGSQLPVHLPKFLEAKNFWALIYSGAFSTGIAYASWHVGVRTLGGSHASIYQNVVTLVAVLGGWIALGEPVMGSQIVGGLLMIGGLVLMRTSRKT